MQYFQGEITNSEYETCRNVLLSIRSIFPPVAVCAPVLDKVQTATQCRRENVFTVEMHVYNNLMVSSDICIF